MSFYDDLLRLCGNANNFLFIPSNVLWVLVVNALCIESLARRVCPNYNVLDSAQPLLRNFRKMCIDRDGNPRDEVARRSGVSCTLLLSSFCVIYQGKIDSL